MPLFHSRPLCYCHYYLNFSNNRPSSRMVLMKDYGRNGFSFYTNYDSRKGKEIAANPFGCLLFYWPKVDRQVGFFPFPSSSHIFCPNFHFVQIRVEGRIEKLPNELADDYWKKRPVKSRIGSKLSEQSKVIPSRNVRNMYSSFYRIKLLLYNIITKLSL